MIHIQDLDNSRDVNVNNVVFAKTLSKFFRSNVTLVVFVKQSESIHRRESSVAKQYFSVALTLTLNLQDQLDETKEHEVFCLLFLFLLLSQLSLLTSFFLSLFVLLLFSSLLVFKFLGSSFLLFLPLSFPLLLGLNEFSLLSLGLLLKTLFLVFNGLLESCSLFLSSLLVVLSLFTLFAGHLFLARRLSGSRLIQGLGRTSFLGLLSRLVGFGLSLRVLVLVRGGKGILVLSQFSLFLLERHFLLLLLSVLHCCQLAEFIVATHAVGVVV